ncbi:hypothetical protein [Streptomyces sp. NPDC058280]|uniref:hypothetical protein n=1 Tax=Streptomyces sp. NPDC058280 TaxID=3346419 RepID=UPI0036E847E4
MAAAGVVARLAFPLRARAALDRLSGWLAIRHVRTSAAEWAVPSGFGLGEDGGEGGPGGGSEHALGVFGEGLSYSRCVPVGVLLARGPPGEVGERRLGRGGVGDAEVHQRLLGGCGCGLLLVDSFLVPAPCLHGEVDRGDEQVDYHGSVGAGIAAEKLSGRRAQGGSPLVVGADRGAPGPVLRPRRCVEVFPAAAR